MRAARRSAARPALRGILGTAFVASLCASAVSAQPLFAQAFGDSDSVAVRFEIGASSDLTNELFYEDAFIDTTFLGRRQVSTPETRVAGVWLTAVEGTRNWRGTRYQLQNELRVGDKLTRNALGLNWTSDLSPDWRLVLNPRLEYRRDRTFGRDLEEWRGQAGGRMRRAFGDGTTFGEGRLHGEFLRTSGTGADFVPDRNVGKASVALDHLAFFGHEWRIGYSITARQFPDSTVRDHFESGWEGRWKYGLLGGHSVALETDGLRRVTMKLAPTSRDNFWEEWVRSEVQVRLNDQWSLRGRAELEAMQYDLQDTTLYFNYQVVRAQLGPRYDRSMPWSFGFGPQIEVLSSRINPAETYRELGGYAEIEFLAAGGWWSLSPAAGWRAYDRERNGSDPLALHSSYAFYELSLFGDQKLPGSMRLRTVATLRQDVHAESIDDATSLYFSLDVRRLF